MGHVKFIFLTGSLNNYSVGMFCSSQNLSPTPVADAREHFIMFLTVDLLIHTLLHEGKYF